MVELNEKAVEAAATALDPEIWAMDGPGLTRSEVQIFHQRRQDSAVAASATVRAYLAALPAPDDGLEVVARLAGINGVILQRHIDDFREQYRDELNAAPGLVCLSAAQAALQSKDEQIERLTRENLEVLKDYRKHYKRADAAEQQVLKLTAEVERLREALEEIASDDERGDYEGVVDFARSALETQEGGK